MEKRKSFISAVVYVYNGQLIIVEFLKGLVSTLSELFEHFEIIVANDCSTDQTNIKVKSLSLQEGMQTLSILNLSHFHGTEQAMNAGRDLAIGDFVFEFDTLNSDYSWDLLMQMYAKMVEKGFDIIGASSDRRQKLTSYIFYRIFNLYSHMGYQLRSETCRLLSRRAINRIKTITTSIPYRKATYANCGLRQGNLVYIAKANAAQNPGNNDRLDTAITSLILFTDLGYRITFAFTLALFFGMLGLAVYALVVRFYGNPVEGWTGMTLILTFAFSGIFAIFTVVLKYLSIITSMLFRKNPYIFESIEKISIGG